MERALLLASELIEFLRKVGKGNGTETAKEVLKSDQAYKRFLAICNAQGRFSEPVLAPHKTEIKAETSGILKRIDNRKIAKLAKLSCAPQSKSERVLLNVQLDEKIEENQLLYTIYAESKGELNYALKYKNYHNTILTIT